MTEPRPGIYQHYKGPLYRVGNLAHDANYPDRTVVMYIAIDQDGAHSGYPDAVRSVDDFLAEVCVEKDCEFYGTRHWETCAYAGNGCTDCEAEGHLLKRFRFIAEDRNQEVMNIILSRKMT
jgi:hypothetical protein